MTRSPYAVTSALGVFCPECDARIGQPCKGKQFAEISRCHSARRKAADEQRTREVNPEASAPSWNWDEETMKKEANKRPYMMNSMDPRPKPLPWPPDVKSLFDPTRKLECNMELFDDETPPKPFFTPPPKPMPPEYYHNVAGRDGILMTPTKAQHDIAYKAAMKPGATEAERNAYLRLVSHCGAGELIPARLDPPDFLPMREPLPQRTPDLNPDDTYRGPRDE